MLNSKCSDSLRALRRFKMRPVLRSNSFVFAVLFASAVGGAFAASAQSFSSPLPVARPANTAGAALGGVALGGSASGADSALGGASLAGVAAAPIVALQSQTQASQTQATQAQWGLSASRFPQPRPLGFHKRAIRSGESLVADSGVSGAVSYAVADLSADARGEVLEARAPAQRLPPASVAKAVTAIYALEHLGGDFRFKTDVLATGPVTSGIVQGDIILSGSGDPTLDTDMLHTLAVQLKDAGITGVTGKFYVFDGALPRIETIDHEQTEYASYNPTITGLNVNYNRVHFEWRKQGTDYSFKMDGRTNNRAPRVSIARMGIAERSTPVFDHTAGKDHDNWTVSRQALGGSGARWLPVRVPSLYAAELFVTLAKAQGVTLPAGQRLEALPAGTTRLARHESATLTVIARDMLKYSTNLTAEVLGLTATKARGLRAPTLKASAEAMSSWAQTRLGTRHLQFVDHSGLGGASIVSTSDMVRLLAAPGVEPLLAPILKPIAVLDQERNLIKNSGISIAAKTGTLDFVSTLAGYVTAPDGRPMAFAIFSGDLPKRAAAKAAGEAVPRGARTFNTRSKKLQQVLLQRWAAYYGS